MFGGIAFLIGGNMAVSASGQGGLMVRVGSPRCPTRSSQPRRPAPSRCVDGRCRGWLRVGTEHLRTKRELAEWVCRWARRTLVHSQPSGRPADRAALADTPAAWSTCRFSEPAGCLQRGFNPAGDTGSDWANEGASPVLSHARSRCASPAGDTSQRLPDSVDRSHRRRRVVRDPARAAMLPRTRSSPTRSGRVARHDRRRGVCSPRPSAWSCGSRGTARSSWPCRRVTASTRATSSIVPLVALAIYIARRRNTGPAYRWAPQGVAALWGRWVGPRSAVVLGVLLLTAAMVGLSDRGPMVPAGGGTFDGSVQFVAGRSANPVGAWSYIALTYDGSTLRLFVDGTQVATPGDDRDDRDDREPFVVRWQPPLRGVFRRVDRRGACLRPCPR